MKRIKYIQTEKYGEFKSESLIKTYTKGEVLANFNEQTLDFWICSPLGTEVIVKGKATSRHKLLLKLKKELVSLGSPDLELEKRAERKKSNV